MHCYISSSDPNCPKPFPKAMQTADEYLKVKCTQNSNPFGWYKQKCYIYMMSWSVWTILDSNWICLLGLILYQYQCVIDVFIDINSIYLHFYAPIGRHIVIALSVGPSVGLSVGLSVRRSHFSFPLYNCKSFHPIFTKLPVHAFRYKI